VKVFVALAILVLGFLGTSMGAVALSAAPVPAVTCGDLKGAFSMPNVTIHSVENVSAGTSNRNTSPLTGPETPIPTVTDLPAFCRVIATLTPTKDSEIGIEVWLPISGWNGNLQAIANHLSGGRYYYGDMAAALKRNYAVASTDTGHTDTADINWAVGHPEKIVDFSWRAVHEMTVTAKAIITTFYGTRPHYSFYNGCSTGGRQTLKEAQRFPDDYDGILSGSGFHYWTHQSVANIWKAQVMLKDGVNGASYLPPSKHQLVVNAAMNECKSLKQVPTDNFLGNPARCAWNPKTLVCRVGQDPNTCITAAQAVALEKIYSTLRNPRTNAEIYPGATRISVPNWAEAAARQAAASDIERESPASLLNLIAPKANTDWRTMNFDTDVALIDEGDAHGPKINAIDPDLSKFKKRGGKLIEYEGWLDSNLAPYSTELYENVIATIGKQEHAASDAEALKETQDFYRFFIAPGMAHCWGGPGPNSFGAEGQTPVPMDPQHDIFSALEQWVEHGVAPVQIIATKYVKDDPKQGIAMQRPVYPYPQEARYKGTGNSADAANFAPVNTPRKIKSSTVTRASAQK
jgi:feruloyl esterase